MPAAADSGQQEPQEQVWLGRGGQLIATSRLTARGCMIKTGNGAVYEVDLSDGSTTILAGEDGQMPALLRGVVAPLAIGAAGHLLLHASAVVRSSGATAVIGPSGTGKSTIASALAASEPDYLADDALAVEIGNQAVCAVSMPWIDPRRYRLGDQQRRATLEQIVCLAPDDRHHEKPALKTLEGSLALEQVLANSYAFHLPSEGIPDRVTKDALELVARVPVRELAYRPTGRAEAATLEAITG